MTSKDAPGCMHTRLHIGTASDNTVYCSNCVAVWYQPFVMAAQIEAQIDTIASMASAMLWDFHQRAVEKYGKEVGGAVAPDMMPPEMFEYRPGDCPGHQFKGGQCEQCGTSQFIGSD